MIRRAIAWTVAGQVVSFAATFGMTVVLARILAPREIGMFAIAAAVSGVLQALAAFGVGTYVVREHQLTPAVLHGLHNQCADRLPAGIGAASRQHAVVDYHGRAARRHGAARAGTGALAGYY
jgi:hypothetical protein